MHQLLRSLALVCCVGAFLAGSSCGADADPGARGAAGQGGEAGGASGASGASNGGSGGNCTAPEPRTCAAREGDACPQEGAFCAVCNYGRCLGGCAQFSQSGYDNFVCLRYSSHLFWRSCGSVMGQLGPSDVCVSTRGDVCQLPKPDPNGCSYPPRPIAGYWYNAATARCEPLDKPICSPNAFGSREQCDAACFTPDAGVVARDAG